MSLTQRPGRAHDVGSRTGSRPNAGARAFFKEGARDMTPLAVGFIPFAVALGTAIGDAAISNEAGWSGSFLIAAGTAHLALIELLDSDAGLVVACGTALVINARLAVYGVGLAPWFRHESRAMRAALAFLIIDPTFALASARFERDDPGPTGRRGYFLGAAGVLFTFWMVAMAVGVVAGAAVPPSLGLSAAAPLMMAGLLAGRLFGAASVVAAGTGGLVAVGGSGLPMRSSLIVAVVVGVGAGWWVDHRSEARSAAPGDVQVAASVQETHDAEESS
jgi:predicted branched-subunit amino acid permease